MDYKAVPQNRSNSVLKTDRFSVKTEANYGSKNSFRSVSLVYRPVFVGFENQYCSGFVIHDWTSYPAVTSINGPHVQPKILTICATTLALAHVG
jgi:hypothetical protein